MDRDKFEAVVLLVLAIIATALFVFTMFWLMKTDFDLHRPCEEYIKEQQGSGYKPIPKRCQEVK